MGKHLIEEKCDECGNKLVVTPNRTECEDMCDKCWNDLNERVIKMQDRDYRMEVARAASFWANELHHSNQKEANLRGFFACVMPEIPQSKVEKLIKQAGR